MNIQSSTPSLNQTQHAKPWHQEFWAWFILTPLIVVMIVSSITITLAIRYADDRVVDDYYKEGRMINLKRDQEQVAQQINLLVSLDFNAESKILQLRLSSDLEAQQHPKELILRMSHPAQAELDQELLLISTQLNHYQANIDPSSFQHRWYLTLTPRDEFSDAILWRLRGEIDLTQNLSLELMPDG